mgnify:FL=1
MFRNEELRAGQALMFDLFRFLTLFSSSQPWPRPIDEGMLGGPDGPAPASARTNNNTAQLMAAHITLLHAVISIGANWENIKICSAE